MTHAFDQMRVECTQFLKRFTTLGAMQSFAGKWSIAIATGGALGG